jgi:HEAT repeat protein
VKIHAWMVVGAALLVLGASQAAWGARTSPRGLGTNAARRAKPAADTAKSTRSTLSPESLDKLRELLAGTDQATVVSATTALGDSSATNAALPLVEMLAAGASPPAAIAAIDALRKLRDPASIDVLVLYASNRSPDMRRHAIEALGGFPDPRVVPTLVERLGDAAPDVRGAAAEALATRGDKTSAPRLLALLKRNDAAAAAPLGAIAPVSLLPAIAELQGSIDDGNLATALGELVKRQDVAEPVRVDIIKTLARISGAASTTALIEYVATLPSADGRPSKVEAQKVIDERSKLK